MTLSMTLAVFAVVWLITFSVLRRVWHPKPVTQKAVVTRANAGPRPAHHKYIAGGVAMKTQLGR